MSYKLNVQNGKVKYIMKQKGGNVGSDTAVDSANWILKQGKPQKSDEFPGYPIAVTVNGSEYHFAGEWDEEKSIFDDGPQSAQKGPCGPDYCELDTEPVYSRKGAEGPNKPRKRRTKNTVSD